MRIIIILLIILIIYKIYRYTYYFIYNQYIIFSTSISEQKINFDIGTEKYLDRILELTMSHNPTPTEIIYLLKYKKFIDLPNVYSMCDSNAINQVQKLLTDILDKKIKGSVVETGVWRGGMGMWMQSILKYYRSDKDIYLFDTFEYFPKPSNNKLDDQIHDITQFLFQTIPSVSDVKNNFSLNGLLDKNIKFIAGDFFQTVPVTPIESISLLRLDSDYYDSTLFILENYYARISSGGYVIIDDYNNEYVGCKQAVDTFRSKYQIDSPIIDTYHGSVYWKII